MLLVLPALAADPAEGFFDRYVAATRDGSASALLALYAPDVSWVHWPGRAPFTDHATVRAELTRFIATGCRTNVELGLFGGDPYSVTTFGTLKCGADAFPVATSFNLHENGLIGTSQTWISPTPLPPLTPEVRTEPRVRGAGVAIVRYALGLREDEHVHPNQVVDEPSRTAHYATIAGVFNHFDPNAPRRDVGEWDLALVVLDDNGVPLRRQLYVATDPYAWEPLSGRPR